MFILSSVFSGLELLSVNPPEYMNKFKVFQNIKLLGEISYNSPNYLLGANIYRTLESC